MYIFMPKLQSLFSILHEDNEEKKKLTDFEKITIALELAKGFEQLHFGVNPPIAHGHLTSRNIFVERDSEIGIRVMIGDLLLQSFLNYASTFMGYKPASSWSSFEVLSNGAKPMLEPTREQDVYSFGMVLWELFHDA